MTRTTTLITIILSTTLLVSSILLFYPFINPIHALFRNDRVPATAYITKFDLMNPVYTLVYPEDEDGRRNIIVVPARREYVIFMEPLFEDKDARLSVSEGMTKNDIETKVINKDYSEFAEPYSDKVDLPEDDDPETNNPSFQDTICSKPEDSKKRGIQSSDVISKIKIGMTYKDVENILSADDGILTKESYMRYDVVDALYVSIYYDADPSENLNAKVIKAEIVGYDCSKREVALESI